MFVGALRLQDKVHRSRKTGRHGNKDISADETRLVNQRTSLMTRIRGVRDLLVSIRLVLVSHHWRGLQLPSVLLSFSNSASIQMKRSLGVASTDLTFAYTVVNEPCYRHCIRSTRGKYFFIRSSAQYNRLGFMNGSYPAALINAPTPKQQVLLRLFASSAISLGSPPSSSWLHNST